MLEGFKGEPEEDDGVEEAIQTMGPEDLQKRGAKNGGEQERGGIPRRERESGRKGKKAWEKGVGSSSLPTDPWPGLFVPTQH